MIHILGFSQVSFFLLFFFARKENMAQECMPES